MCYRKNGGKRKMGSIGQTVAILNSLTWENYTKKVTFRSGPVEGEGISQEKMWRKEQSISGGTQPWQGLVIKQFHLE